MKNKNSYFIILIIDRNSKVLLFNIDVKLVKIVDLRDLFDHIKITFDWR